jgi:hypothetical protein
MPDSLASRAGNADLGRGHRGLSGNNKSGQRLTRKTDEQTKIAQRENWPWPRSAERAETSKQARHLNPRSRSKEETPRRRNVPSWLKKGTDGESNEDRIPKTGDNRWMRQELEKKNRADRQTEAGGHTLHTVEHSRAQI